jgi:hypothetical protein
MSLGRAEEACKVNFIWRVVGMRPCEAANQVELEPK